MQNPLDENTVPAFPSAATGDTTAGSGVLSPTEEILRVKATEEDLPAATLAAGAKVGHFRVLAPLGRGGMGVVYRAEDESLRREVALKVLPPFHVSDAERRLRLLREARAAAAVNHPNIATIYEIGEADGLIYIAMELIHGQTLRQRLDAGRLPVAEAIGVARQILRGLQKAHAAGLVHRDLKPDNVMFADEGLAKVLDFGIAKHRCPALLGDAAAEEGEPLTDPMRSGPLLGTPRYMSPEQAAGAVVDQRSDLFSFGVLFYEMLTGRHPFSSSGETILDVISAISLQAPVPPSQRNPEVPPLLSQIVERCLEKKPSDRYPDCASLGAELDRLSMGGKESPPSPSPPILAPTEAGPRRRAGSLFWTGIAASLGALCAVAVAVQPWHRWEGSALPAATTAAVAPVPTAITDLPPPVSRNPEAIALYLAAMQNMRDSNWGQAEANLSRAAALDPSMAAAHLRLAMIDLTRPTTEHRASYARAVQTRASLSERDQVLLRALEPQLTHDPPDLALTVQRLREATERYPLDAELYGFLSWLEEADPEASLRDARRATELDPQYADSFQTIGIRLAELDRPEEAYQALRRCIELSPASADCHGSVAVQYYMPLGRCREAEEELRSAILSTPKASTFWYTRRPVVLYAMGRSHEAVFEALAQKWAELPEETRRPVELLDRAELDFDAGQFAKSEARCREAIPLLQSESDAEPHMRLAERLVKIDVETGRLKDAAKIADDFVKRKDVWVWRSPRAARRTAMYMLRTMLHAGALSPEDFAARRADALGPAPKSAPDSDQVDRWLFAYAHGITQPEEAQEALTALLALPESARRARPSDRTLIEDMGRVYQLAGNADAALPLLRPEVKPCTGPGEGHASSLYIGEALEQKGDKEGACAAYAAVLERWENASPHSISASTAWTRAKALGCPDRRPASAGQKGR